MSEVFDPEKVRLFAPRWGGVRGVIMDEDPIGKYTLASDFYQLLALYREVRQEFIQELTRDMNEDRATLLRSLS